MAVTRRSAFAVRRSFARVTAAPAPDRFDAVDTNDDGKIDRDGRLSRAEVATARDPSTFDTIDANKDGAIDRTESQRKP